MWTAEHRQAARREGLRYASDLTDAEWALVAPLIPPARRGGRPRDVDVRRKVPQVAFKPDWARHGKAAPFKRNDQMLDVLPIGVIVFPGSGISANLADKARKMGIPVWKFGDGGA